MPFLVSTLHSDVIHFIYFLRTSDSETNHCNLIKKKKLKVKEAIVLKEYSSKNQRNKIDK